MTDAFDFKPVGESQDAGHVFAKSWSAGGHADDAPSTGTQAWPVKWVGPSEKGVTHDLEFETWAAQSMTELFG
ncbi:MAG: hypothetical protein AAFR46_02425 [Pseudomonadota bacterium]